MNTCVKKSPYIIAELGSNHNGDMELAKALIKEAKEVGVDCVKFQSWSKDSIFSRKKYEENYFLSDDYRNRDDFTLEEIVDEYAISEKQLLEMKQYADAIGIAMASTPFSKREADFLVNQLDAPFIKVASMDLNNLPFLSYLAKFKLPIILSTGFGVLDEIEQAVKTIENAGNYKISILHCISIYPPLDRDLHLNNIITLKNIYPEYKIGFSDHTIGSLFATAAIALGAEIIEKHFTLNKSMVGWDHKISADKKELQEIVEAARRIPVGLGKYRIQSPESAEQKKEFCRSIVVNKDLEPGHVLREDDIDFKRPGLGILPAHQDFILGRRLKKSIKYDHILQLEDFD